MSLRESILSALDTVYEVIKTPEWGADTTVTIRSLTAEERDAFDASIVEYKRSGKNKKRKEAKVNTRQLRAKLVVKAACVAPNDPTPLFSDADVPALAGKNAAAVDRLYDAAQRLCGFSDEDIEELETGND